MVWNAYFELKWTSGSEVITRQFRMYQSSQPLGNLRMHGFQRNLDGYAVVVRAVYMPRVVEGEIPFYATDDQTSPWGSKANLIEAIEASDLQAKLWDDTAFWNAIVVGHWQPRSHDPFGNVQSVGLRIEGK